MHTLTRRAFSRLALAAPVLGPWSIASGQAAARAGRLLVGYPPGGTLDTTARQLAEAWRRQGRNYIVDNRAGAAGRIANSLLKREKPDAGTLLCTHASALTIYPHVYTRLPYDPATDLVPVSPLVAATCAFAVGHAVPASVGNLKDYVAWVRVASERAAYASPAAGSVAHFLGFQLSEAAGLNLQHVAYRGSGPALQDLIGGQVPAYFGFIADFLPYLQTGKVRILGVAAEKRSAFLPGTPTFAEQGFQKIRGGETYGVFAPPGTPEPIVRALHESIVAASADADLRAALARTGLDVQTLPPRDYGKQLQEEREHWGPVVRASGFRSEE